MMRQICALIPTILTLWCWTLSALAFLPVTGIHYQGRVSVDGQPFTGTGDFKFALVDDMGLVIWTHDGSFLDPPTQSIQLDVENGLFSVNLGQEMDMSPLDSSYFSMGVHLRVWFNDRIHGWQQLGPDQQLAAVPYAFIAQDAETLNGHAYSSSWTDDQPDHDGEVPDNLTINNGYLFAPVGGNVGIGTTSPDYLLTVNGDMQVAGAVRDASGNPGTDGQIMQSTGSSVAWTDVPSSSSEYRTPISTVPIEISTPGSYYLTQNLTHATDTSNAIVISADHVTLDLNGFSVSGSGSGPYSAINVTGDNVTVMNGTLRSALTGITFGAVSEGYIFRVRCELHDWAGISFSGSSGAIVDCISSNNAYGISISNIQDPLCLIRIEGCQVRQNTGSGIFTGTHVQGILLRNTISHNGEEGIKVQYASIIKNNVAVQNSALSGVIVPDIDAAVGSILVDNLGNTGVK